MSEVDAFTQVTPSLNASQVFNDDDDHGSDGSGGGTSHRGRNAQDSCSSVTDQERQYYERSMKDYSRTLATVWGKIVVLAKRLDAITCVKKRCPGSTDEAEEIFQDQYDRARSLMRYHMNSLTLPEINDTTLQGRQLKSQMADIREDTMMRCNMLESLDQRLERDQFNQSDPENSAMEKEIASNLANLSAERLARIVLRQSEVRGREQIEGRVDIVEGKSNGRLHIAILPTGEMGHFVTDPWCDFTPMEKLSKYVPSARSLKPSNARILDCSNMSEWPEVGPGWEHRHFTKKILQQLRSHALIYVASKDDGAIERSSEQAASERNRLWNNRYLVTDQEIQSCIQEGMMRDLIEDFHYTFVTRTGSFVNAYQDEWERKARLMADDAHSLAAQLLTSGAQECILEAIQHTRNDDLLSCFASVCRQDTWRALKSVDETLATNQGSQELVEKALSRFEAVVKDAESKMQELRDNDYGKALRKELADRHESISIPASLKGLIEYLQKVRESQSAPSTTTAEPPAA